MNSPRPGVHEKKRRVFHEPSFMDTPRRRDNGLEGFEIKAIALPAC
jgi:hypothetical protein